MPPHVSSHPFDDRMERWLYSCACRMLAQILFIASSEGVYVEGRYKPVSQERSATGHGIINHTSPRISVEIDDESSVPNIHILNIQYAL
jgi:hypothetical protein